MIFIWEMANNHQGSVELGKKIIDQVSDITNEFNIKSAIKFQFRDIETFIHKDFRDSDVKHVKRFIETELSKDDFKMMSEYAREKGLMVIATPFDEKSLELCKDVDYIKIASCSMTDWSLLEEASSLDKKMIVSTGGYQIEDIDNVVSFLTHKEIDFSLMHCVALYPTDFSFNMDFIDKLKSRYPNVEIGYSGHECPSNLLPGIIAACKGVSILERHFGVEDLNSYSLDSLTAEIWVNSIVNVISICGDREKSEINNTEIENIRGLQRGVYAKHPIKKGDTIISDNVFYAMPCLENQTSSGDFNQYRTTTTATKDYFKNDSICEKVIQSNIIYELRKYVHKAKGMLSEAGIDIGNDYEIELSHHYGFDQFDKFGAVIVDLINREYCKKLIIQFPKQCHPEHYHKNKEETFQILWGDLILTVEGKINRLKKGDLFLVERHRFHSFTTDNGVIFEEISTTHIKGDSYYTDTNICKSDPIERKSKVEKP